MLSEGKQEELIDNKSISKVQVIDYWNLMRKKCPKKNQFPLLCEFTSSLYIIITKPLLAPILA